MSYTQMKLVAVGDGAVGKTSSLLSFSSGCFPVEYVPTIFDNFNCNMMVDKVPINLNLWDTAGQEDYDRLRPLSYPHTDVFLVMFSTVSPNSFQNVRNKWIPEIKHFQPDAAIVLVGTKVDIRDDQDTLSFLAHKKLVPVSTEEGQGLANEIGAYQYCEISALKQEGLVQCFEASVRSVMEVRQQNQKRVAKKNAKCSLF